MFFHRVTGNGDLYWAQVVEDIERTLRWAETPDQTLAIRFQALLLKLLEHNP